MTLITTCPACQTQFEVNDAQLQAYGGQVRCGACEQIFDAHATLQVLDEPGEGNPYSTGEHGTDAMVTPVSLPDDPAPQSIDPVVDGPVTHSGLDAVEDAILASGTETDSAPDSVNSTEGPLTDAAVVDADDAHAELATTDKAEAENAPPVPGFLQTTDQISAAPLSRRQQVIYVILMVALTCLLAGQSVYLLRHRLASLFPASQPWLTQMCQHLHCSMGLPRQIQQLVIDDADIQEQPEHAHVLVFSSVLINHGDQTLAFPDIELTLTGTGDEPLLRRRISPADYLPAGMPLANGIAAQQEVRVQALLAVEDTRVAGYRVAIDYP